MTAEETNTQNIPEELNNGILLPTTSSYSVTPTVQSEKCCWVCFATDEDDENAQWVKPCKCIGSTKWVHQNCLQRWVDEKQKGGGVEKVQCSQCKTEYLIVYPHMGLIVVIMDTVDSIVYKLCPFMAAGIVVGAVYWTAVTYGAITIMQVIGHQDGMAIMEQADPMILLVGLPAIPVALIVGKMIKWEDTVLMFIRSHLVNVPLIKYVLPFHIERDPYYGTPANDLPPVSDPVSATRILCGALLLPSVAVLFGNFFFYSVKSNFHKTVLGGLTFIAIKGCLRIYHKQQQYIRQCRRKILDYTESNISFYLGNPHVIPIGRPTELNL